MRLATVIATAPLTVRRDGDGVNVAAKATNVTVAVNDRVLTVNVDNLVYIVVKVV